LIHIVKLPNPGMGLRFLDSYFKIELQEFIMKKTFSLFRKIAFAEGVSFLVLLLVAMPLKYFANLPMAVTVMGGIHGLLFVGFMILAYLVKDEYNKRWGWMAKAFLASVIPFGTFVMDKEWKKEEAAVTNS
jgi:integral membrane protein